MYQNMVMTWVKTCSGSLRFWLYHDRFNDNKKSNYWYHTFAFFFFFTLNIHMYKSTCIHIFSVRVICCKVHSNSMRILLALVSASKNWTNTEIQQTFHSELVACAVRKCFIYRNTHTHTPQKPYNFFLVKPTAVE